MKNKVAFVTGSSRGIGRAVAIKYAEAGYNLVICCSKDFPGLEEVKNEILSKGVDCLALTGDLSDEETVISMFQKIKERFSGLDVLVNNAGISVVSLFTDTKKEDWDRVMATNLTSVFLCSKEAVKMMLPNKSGSIINISSIWGNIGASMEVAYSASKAGVNGLTKALAKELAPSGICVNAIACGVIDTTMNDHLSPCEKEELAEEIPAGRFGSPEEIGSVALSLGECTSYLTGQIVTVSGGYAD